MKLSFDDEESFKEVVGSFYLTTPQDDPNVPQDSDRDENICFNNSPGEYTSPSGK